MYSHVRRNAPLHTKSTQQMMSDGDSDEEEAAAAKKKKKKKKATKTKANSTKDKVAKKATKTKTKGILTKRGPSTPTTDLESADEGGIGKDLGKKTMDYAVTTGTCTNYGGGDWRVAGAVDW